MISYDMTPDRLPKYAPSLSEARLDDVPTGSTGYILTKNGKIKEVTVLEKKTTKQNGNPTVATDKGIYGGGTAFVFETN